ncbi:MAG: hypothetical protein NC548_33025 [Lachnospiraceae bacterium]|nr:hypothetical protein [Lachnospiraceae bacterium]MCM1230365.1 hypothetical protein [Ruminococcus flavefaciens]
MDKENLINIIENGWQVGISKIFNKSIAYIYAIQKIKGKYMVYINEYNLNELYYYEFEDEIHEKTYLYDSISDVIDNFNAKYDIAFEDLNVSKGQKFFNPELCL